MFEEAGLITAVEDISSTKKRLKIEIPAAVIEKEYRDSVNKVRQKAKIPGYRPGKAPENLIEKKFGEDIKSDIIDRLVPRYYSEALKEAGLVPVTLPQFESSLDVRKDGPLSFALTVEVRPPVGDLKYEGLQTDEIIAEVGDDEIENAVKGLREERAVFEAVDREIRGDDLIVIDYVKLDPGGEKELSSARDQVMDLGSGVAPKGFLDEIVGRRKGDVVEVALPEVEGGRIREDSTAGNHLRITVKEVKEKKLPTVDDEFAKDFGHETIESLESLREKIREGILKAKQEKNANRQKEQLLDLIIENHDFEVPESLLEEELEKLVVNEKASRKQAGELIDESAKKGTPEAEGDKELAERLRPAAVRNVKTAVLLDVIAEKELITVTEDELKTRIGLLSQHFQTTPEAVMNLFITRDGSLDTLRRSIRDEKVMSLVLSKAEIKKGA
jgi:trigger factor